MTATYLERLRRFNRDVRLYLVTADRGTYSSALVTVDVTGAEPGLLAIETFTGVATGVAADGDRLYVADGDRGIRVYDRSAAGTSLLGIVVNEKAVAP